MVTENDFCGQGCVAHLIHVIYSVDAVSSATYQLESIVQRTARNLKRYIRILDGYQRNETVIIAAFWKIWKHVL